MITGSKEHHLKAAVIFSTRFGTTEKVAKAFESGLNEAGVQTSFLNASEVLPDSLSQYDLVCVGGPTEGFSASKPMKEFLESAKKARLEGKLGFAFDTRIDSRLSGSAAKYIEHALDDQGMRLVATRESAIVTSRKESGRIVGADLKEGEEKRFEQVGLRVGAAAAEAEKSLASP